MDHAPPPPRFAPGGLVIGVLGLAAYVISLLVPWYATVTFTKLSFEETKTDAFAFGIGSGLYIFGVLLVAAIAFVALATQGTARDVLGMTALASASVTVAAVCVIVFRIADASERVLAVAAETDRDSSPDTFVSLQAGPILGGVAVFLLAVAVTRITWPAFAAPCYAAAGTAACLLALAIPWGGREAIFEDRVDMVNYWFPHFGLVGALGACAAVVALSASAATFALGRQAWWPPLVALVASAGVMVSTGVVGGDDDILAADPRLADATYTDGVVNTGLPALAGFVAAVMFTCSLVSSIRQYRRARRPASVTPVFLPPDHRAW